MNWKCAGISIAIIWVGLPAVGLIIWGIISAFDWLNDEFGEQAIGNGSLIVWGIFLTVVLYFGNKHRW